MRKIPIRAGGMLVVFATLLGCSENLSDSKSMPIDIPPAAKVIGEKVNGRSVALLVDWKGNHIGLYKTNIEKIETLKYETVPLAIDKTSLLNISNGLGKIIARPNKKTQFVLVFFGPCKTRRECIVLDFANSTTLKI
ncbi:hypothetical protein [Trichormus sp. NMC-1]|uniref:hypothetical protein n=1 Tax=Trichormus sp. NMC-1 TaxID=1853259 RepID=UPI0008DC1AF5|nr:hypothetical protein [Trichormus sp. NMC-1]